MKIEDGGVGWKMPVKTNTRKQQYEMSDANATIKSSAPSEDLNWNSQIKFSK